MINKHDISEYFFTKFRKDLRLSKNNQQMNNPKWACKNSTLHLTALTAPVGAQRGVARPTSLNLKFLLRRATLAQRGISKFPALVATNKIIMSAIYLLKILRPPGNFWGWIFHAKLLFFFASNLIMDHRIKELVLIKVHFSDKVKVGWKTVIERWWEVYYSARDPVRLINSHIDSFREAKM